MESYYYRTLDPAGKEQYDAIAAALVSFSPSVAVKGRADDVYRAVLDDHPELFYVGKETQVAADPQEVRFTPAYLCGREEAAEIRARLSGEADRVLALLINAHQSAYDKALVIHDYLKTNVRYNFDAVRQKTTRGFENSYTAVGALLDRLCVCAGFAAAYKYLLDRVGVECHVVSGTGSCSFFSGPHAWNIVRINGYYHHVDVTWDNQSSTGAHIPNYGYFGLDDETLSRDHTWDRSHCPACPDAPYNYFRVNNSIMDSKAQLERYIYENLLSEEELVTFKVKKGSPLEAQIDGSLEQIIRNAGSRAGYVKIASVSREYLPNQQVYTLCFTYR